MTCKQIRQESAQLFYRENEFRVACPTNRVKVWDTLKIMRLVHRNAMGSLTQEVCNHILAMGSKNVNKEILCQAHGKAADMRVFIEKAGVEWKGCLGGAENWCWRDAKREVPDRDDKSFDDGRYLRRR